MTMEKKHENKKAQREEFGQDLSPDDLDTRNKEDMTKEQIKNTAVSNNKLPKPN